MVNYTPHHYKEWGNGSIAPCIHNKALGGRDQSASYSALFTRVWEGAGTDWLGGRGEVPI